MAGLLENFVKAAMKNELAVNYPHLELPAIVYARVQSVKPLERYELRDLVIYNDDSHGSSFRGHITIPWYEYSLTILDRFGHPDQKFPTVPRVRSRKQLQQGAIAVVALPFGELAPSIIGEVAL